jgi:hypothetical protein
MDGMMVDMVEFNSESIGLVVGVDSCGKFVNFLFRILTTGEGLFNNFLEVFIAVDS